MSDNLRRAGKRAGEHAFFLASLLVKYQQFHELTDQQLAERLGCSLDGLTCLRLCRVPETEQEISQVAARGRCSPEVLAAVLKEIAEEK